MSIIANALQKQHLPEKKSANNNLFIWKALLLTALLVIIILLSVLIWLLTKQPVQISSATKIAQEEVVVRPSTSHHLAQPQIVVTASNNTHLEQKAIDLPVISTVKPITKVSFDTKPLPLISLSQANDVSDQQKKTVDTVDKEHADSSLTDSNVFTANETALKSTEISETLKAHFQEALINHQDSDNNADEGDNLNIYKMDIEFQQQVPTIRYAFHVYSSNKNERWIRINGEDLKEGQFDSSRKIQVVDIQQNQTIFRVAGKDFYLKSLTDWLPL